jgi:tRNA(adenine34) deaminase
MRCALNWKRVLSPGALILLAFLSFWSAYAGEGEKTEAAELDELSARIQALVPDPHYPDDPFILVTLQEAIKARREGSGGIGACLVGEVSGEIVARGHNRQYSPYFRSDMHAEMDLMDRYEDLVKIMKIPGRNPRRVYGLVLYSSVEPCPMCLTRIINTGIKKAYYAVPDPEGGMVHKIKDLPPFWRNEAAGRIYAQARCSPIMQEIAARLFHHGQS